MQDAKEEVRARLNIEDVIGEYVQLKRAGRNFKGLSPFSGERTPSFVVSPDKHIWHDFSSGKGGDVFGFIMEVEGMDFRQALEHLARKAGVDLSMYQTKDAQSFAKKKKRLLEAHELATAYYQQSLLQNRHALEYVFQKRGLSKDIVSEFKIGYAPTSGDALVNFLKKKGFSQKELNDSGLTNRYGSDLFRGRMMVPLMDGGGQVIGFTARIIEDEPNAPKYLNTPQTLLYDKSRHVFGLSQAKEAIRQGGYSVIVEGNLDVVSSHQAGVKQVVATAGTALTEHHMKALSRLSGTVRMAFDGDKAGIAATERAIPIGQAVGAELSVVSLPGDAKDPDELIQQDPQLWVGAIEAAVPAVDWVIQQYAEREDLTTALGKRRFTSAGLVLVRSLSDPVEQEHYMQQIAGHIQSSVTALQEKLRQLSAPTEEPKRLKPVVAPQTAPNQDDVAYQDNVLALMAIDVALRALLNGVDDELFIGEQRQAIVAALRTSKEVWSDTPKDLQKYDTYVKILLLKADTRYAGWSDKDRHLEAARLIRQTITEHKKIRKETLLEQLRDAEAAGDDPSSERLRAELNNLIKEIQHG